MVLARFVKMKLLLSKIIKRANCLTISIEIYTTFKLSPILTHSDFKCLFLPTKLTIMMVALISGVDKIYKTEAVLVKKQLKGSIV